MRLKDVITVPTSSLRRPSPAMARSLASISAIRATVRPTSQMMSAPANMPILKTRDAMKHMTVGQVLEMTSDDPASEADMISWAARTGHELLEIDRDGAVYRFLVRKTR